MNAVVSLYSAAFATYVLAVLAGCLLPPLRRPKLWNLVVHLLTAIASALVVVASVGVLVSGQTFTVKVSGPGGLSFLPTLYIKIDGLSAFLALVISLVAAYSSIFAIGYVDEYYESPEKMVILGICLPSFVASMILVALAGDAILFLIAWEIMSVTSFFLILTEYESEDVRRAAVTYMIYASFSAICILAGFALAYAYTGSYVFDAWKVAGMSANWGIVFLLLLLGFSAKAGAVPFHSWLPRAHPAAPSHVSALLSGVMVKLSMYGIVRVMLYALGAHVAEWWGILVVFMGAVSTFYGVALAIIQHDIKRLLAYHTIENIGIIMLGLGVALCAYAAHNYLLASLALIAGLFHLLNHALFKSLLFLCSGALLHQIHTKDIEEMGGLYKKMKATAVAFLIASLGITAVPLFNGFASEWCTYNSLALGIMPGLSTGARIVNLLSIVSLAAAGVLAVYCFTKVFGLVFLGQPRSRHAEEAEKEPIYMPLGYVAPSLLIILLGVAPGIIVTPLSNISKAIVGAAAPLNTPALGLLVNLWHTPAAYIPIVIAASMAILGFLIWSSVAAKVRPVTITQPFVSGVAFDKAMVPSATLYVGSLEELMATFYGVKKHYERREVIPHWVSISVKVLEKPYALTAKLLSVIRRILGEAGTKAAEKIDDMFYAMFSVIGAAATRIARIIVSLQCGSLSVYLTYIYIGFIVLLIYYLHVIG